jgi:beta-phosphoglucomutase-like phosphatase (HAD superfamily)
VRSGLSGIFAVTVFSQDHGIAKPDRRLYDIAAAEVGATAETIAMIGDSLVNDVTAAQAAGWHGIWLNRESIPCPDLHAPDAEIASLGELPEAIAEACWAYRLEDGPGRLGPKAERDPEETQPTRSRAELIARSRTRQAAG